MIENDDLKAILLTATDLSVICELYDSDTVPGVGGFDPDDAIECFAAIDGITFGGRQYKRLVQKFGRINRTLTKEINSATVDFSNMSREISQFEFNYGFEGLILVIRMISRSLSTTTAKSQILFAGRCDKPQSGKKTSLTVSAKFILGSMDVTIPRRKFGPEDSEGRVESDPEFEGFIFVPQYGTTTYSVRKKRGGLFGWLGMHKRVRTTLQYSSYSDLDATKPVPEVFGRAQLEGVHIAYADVGTYIKMNIAFCEGEGYAIENIRSIDTEFPLDYSSIVVHYGKTGVANGNNTSWVGPGYYSRTMMIRARANNSPVDIIDPAPDVAAVIFGRLVKIPNSLGVWVGAPQWSDNAAAHSRFLITSSDYYQLDESWLDDSYAAESFNFNAEYIFDTSIDDFSFVEAG